MFEGQSRNENTVEDDLPLGNHDIIDDKPDKKKNESK
jgi:hypothetical protein